MEACCNCPPKEIEEIDKRHIYYELENMLLEEINQRKEYIKNSTIAPCEFIKINGEIEGLKCAKRVIGNLITSSYDAENVKYLNTKAGITQHIESLENELRHYKTKLLNLDIKTEAKEPKGK